MASDAPLSCGLEYTSAVWDLTECLKNARKARYGFIIVPLVHPSYKQEFISGPALNRSETVPFTRPDMILMNSEWSTMIVGSFSYHDEVDSNISHVRINSEKALLQELSLASHLNIPAVTFKLTACLSEKSNLARIIYNKLVTPTSLQFWIQIPMTNPEKQSLSYRNNNIDDIEFENPWDWWNDFRSFCDFDKKLGVSLIVSRDIPDDNEIMRWLGEPIKTLVFPSNVFLTNKKGYPVLSKAHQELVHKFSSMNIQMIVTGVDCSEYISHYYTYLDQLWKRGLSEFGPRERFGRGYEDYLQFPLQPLMDNLESGTYEVFEKDPVKYSQYQSAILKALIKKREEYNKILCTKPIIITVVGAGRGPLVRAALNAGDIASCKIKVFAIEKNPNAVLTLRALQGIVFDERVTIVSCDMRDWKAPENADILVSELLGSFGDNELSPECLDGAQNYLKDDGISIPQSYTSYIAPVQSSKLYNELRSCQDKDKSPISHFETPYVVYLQNKYDIDSPQPLFTFHHPNRDQVIDNSRYEQKKFNVQQKAVLHGFSGYFDVILFEDVTISIVPQTHSNGMFSWFPIFFPLKEPVHVNKGDTIEVHFWRRCSPKNIWYEWSISKPRPLTIHNPNGRSYNMGL